MVVLCCAVVCWPVAVGALTTNLTVQRAGYYRQAVDDADVYRRLYDEILADPAVAGITQDLLAGLPVPADVVVDNLRIVAPESTVRGTVNTLSTQIADYLGGSRPTLALTVDLRPLFTSIARLATIYLAGQVSGTPTFQAHDVAAVTGILVEGLDQMAQGRRPAGVPTFDLTTRQADRVAAVLVGRLPPTDRMRVRGQVTGLLRQGRVPAALAVVGPLLFQGDTAALADLRRRLAGDQLDLGTPLARAHDSAGTGALRALHGLGRAGTLALAVGAALLAVAGVGVTARRCGRRWADVSLLTGAAMMAGGAAALFLGKALPALVGDPVASVVEANPTWPTRVGALLRDLQDHLVGGVSGVWTTLAAVVLLAGGAAVGAGLLARLLPRTRPRPLALRRAAALVAVAGLLVGGSWLAAPTHFHGAEAASCNGSRALCALRYDEAVYAASHNAMSASAADFVGATQDPDLAGQLDTGVRALLLDVHHWTTPAQVETFLAGLRPRERDALAPLARGAQSARPGLWLCHSVCQFGSVDLDAALRSVGDWLERNPSEVVTLILQDGVPAAEVIAAFDRAGLTRHLVTPPADPHGRWPTLGHLVASDRRLVVFAENADVAGSWYRQLFRYASDTPFDVPSSAGFSCRVRRGSVEAPMVVVNHWVEGDGPGRTYADVVNRAPSLLTQVHRCEQDGRRPTFLATDFTTIGDLVPTVAALNADRVHPDR